MQRRLAAAVLAVLATGLLLALPAGAAKVGWHETAKNNGTPVMTYTVASITLDSNGWTARIAFANVSKKTIQVGSRFGLAFYRRKDDEATSKAVGLAEATGYSSKLPAKLGPGQKWSGTISGTGSPAAAATLYVRVVFGPFTGVPGQKRAIYWVTDHSLPVPGANVV